MTTATLVTSTLYSVPVVLFRNTNRGLNDRCVWVCTSAAEAERQAARLRGMPHIADVEVMNAPVKGLERDPG